jgi:hypothetical protein
MSTVTTVNPPLVGAAITSRLSRVTPKVTAEVARVPSSSRISGSSPRTSLISSRVSR